MTPSAIYRIFCLGFFLFLFFGPAPAQEALVKQINALNTPAAGLMPLRILAADEMMGRATARPEIHIAARYIAEEFRRAGLLTFPGAPDYFQSFGIEMTNAGREGYISLGKNKLSQGSDWVEMMGKDLSLKAPLVYAGYATEKELAGLDLKGKIILSEMGDSAGSTFMEGFLGLDAKAAKMKAHGALALLERFRPAGVNWRELRDFALSERAMIVKEDEFPAFFLQDSSGSLQAQAKQGVEAATIEVSGTRVKQVKAENVMGWIRGTDPVLRNEYVLLSAHYDHIGLADKAVLEEGKMDSIYNGARDNAIGTTAVIDAARYFSRYPPRRSILFISYTGEEIGLLGSSYFADHPTLPLKKIVYNLNIDNASYNDTNIVTVIGLGRTTADPLITRACRAYGLSARPDPAPEEDLFDRSDNVSLAAKGIPAPTFSLGMTQFDEVVRKRYHQLSDEVGNFDLDYAIKFINSFILSARLIADGPAKPLWKKGDKYEKSWKILNQ